MTVPKTSPAQNHLRQPFVPLPSGFEFDPARFNFVEAFARSTTPKVLSNEVTVPNAATPFLNNAVPTAPQLTDVLQLSLPVPMPVSLVLGAWVSEPDRFRRPTRLSASVIASPTAPIAIQGVFVVEWGLGTARNYTVCDLAAGSLQIPVTQSLKVSAQWAASGIPGGVATLQAIAQAYPGAAHPAPDARVTVQSMCGPGEASWLASFDVPPYARDFEAGVFSTASPVPLANQLSVTMRDNAGTPLGKWILVPADPVVPTTAALPDVLLGRMLPGGAFDAPILITNVPGQSTNAYLAFRVRL